MKILILLLLTASLQLSCQSQEKLSKNHPGNVKIELNEINDHHPNKKQFESFINNYKEAFVHTKTDRATLEHDTLILNRYDFRSSESGVNLILIFCENQKDATTIGKANFTSTEENQKFGVNGAVLFVVKGNDSWNVDDVLSWFSGDE